MLQEVSRCEWSLLCEELEGEVAGGGIENNLGSGLRLEVIDIRHGGVRAPGQPAAKLKVLSRKSKMSHVQIRSELEAFAEFELPARPTIVITNIQLQLQLQQHQTTSTKTTVLQAGLTNSPPRNPLRPLQQRHHVRNHLRQNLPHHPRQETHQTPRRPR